MTCKPDSTVTNAAFADVFRRNASAAENALLRQKRLGGVANRA